ncbi:hypothetical protein [Vulcaniibacterium tengchongense]|uniref:hypothetical protein n=1 Tax=Vulcaniibacterium tengchongense TaxID=1273429 RepID=UPI000F4EB43F|nr:hypothetical protein [Vulcaniibacterium tengchongense]
MRTMSRRIDSVIALGIGFALLAATSIFGDPIYAGIRYYLIAWFGLVGLAQIAKAPPLFTTGAAAALAASFLFYWAWQASLPQPEGLLGLGHLFSLPGLGIAAVIAAVIARRRQMLPWAAFAAGLLACCAGFAASHFVVCRSMVYCGSLSGISG